MSVNLVVWKWKPDYDTAAKRRKYKMKYDTVTEEFAEKGDHFAMDKVNFKEFEAAIKKELGSQAPKGDYVLEKYPHARCFNLSDRNAHDLIPVIGGIAQEHGLVAAEF